MPPTVRREITALRLRAQRIAESDFQSAGDVVGWMLAMQAQDFAGAKWSVGLRLPGSVEADIDAAIERRDFVRSWPMRGTLHFIRGEDLPWLLQLTTERLLRESTARRAELGITDDQLAVAKDAAIAVLTGGVILERNAMLSVFENAGVSVETQRGYHILWYLAQTGVLVFGPASGKQQTFTLLDEWVPHPRQLERDEALGELALRYFRSHGPATVKDLARWASITLTEARVGLAVAKDSLEEREFDGVAYYLAPDLPHARGGAFALPGFDEYMLGYQDRSAGLAPEYNNRIVPGGNGMFLSTLVIDGTVVGTWRRNARARQVVIEVDWFATPSARKQATAERALRRYGEFIGKEIVVTHLHP